MRFTGFVTAIKQDGKISSLEIYFDSAPFPKVS